MLKVTSMTEKPSKPDLAEYEEEETPLDDVLRRLFSAKPASQQTAKPKEETAEDGH